jgi:hypothetical protein
MFTVSFTPAERRGDQASASVESGTAGGPTTSVGASTTAAHRSRAHSYDSAADNDLRRCARCGEQREYCHGHPPIIPNPSLDLPPNPPRITMSGSVLPNSMARFNLSHAQATALATCLVNSLDQNHQDTPEVPPAYDYGEEFAQIVAEGLGIAPDIAAEGLGIRNRRGRRGGQGQGNRPQPVPDARRPANPQPTQEHHPVRRPSSPTPAGFKHNRGPAFIPFHIRNEHGGETPAHYIHAHLDAPNPFVEGRLSLNGPTYHSEIHAAAIHDLDVPPPMLTANILRLLDTDYMGHEHVDEALGEIGDRLLQAEVIRYR